MEMIRYGRQEEGAQIKAFAQRCFQTPNEIPDFAKLLPKVYREPEKTAREHLIFERDGRIRGLLYRTVTEMDTGSGHLRVGHIGTVCTDPDERGCGIMGRLMTKALEELKAQNCAVAVLSGKRSRYERFGFIPSGVKTEFVLCEDNLSDMGIQAYSLRPFEAEDAGSAYSLYMKKYPRMERQREIFADILGSWHARVMTLCDNGRFCGYCTGFVQEGYFVVAEVMLETAKAFGPLCRLVNAAVHLPLKVCLTPETEEYALAARICERYIIGPDHNICLLKPLSVIRELLDLKNRYCRLPSGAFRIDVAEWGPLYLQTGSGYGGEDACDQEIPKIELSCEQAVHFLFSPLSRERSRMAARYPAAAAWFPLPLCFLQNDCY